MTLLTELRKEIEWNPKAVKFLDELEERITNKRKSYLNLYEDTINEYHLGIAVGLEIALNMEVNDDMIIKNL